MSYQYVKNTKSGGNEPGVIKRIADGAFIPTHDLLNVDCEEYKAWLAKGNTPEAAD
tara:strand:+ start:48 stop:215 length:168 start_codon:yes stop_codon:yes gene_type:complete